MENLFRETEQNIKKIRDLVDGEELVDEELYPLDNFRYNKDFISDLINELRETRINASVINLRKVEYEINKSKTI